jgi:hypothetical protein
MTMPPRLIPLAAQYDHAWERLLRRLVGPNVDSGDGCLVEVPMITDAEYRWEPAAGSRSVRRKTDGPGLGAIALVGAGEWGRDGGRPHRHPPPVTTIAWRMHHLTEMLLGRADWTIGDRTFNEQTMEVSGDAASAIIALQAGIERWRTALDTADDTALDTVGHCAYPDGSDPDEPFLQVVSWVNQEILHHAVEIALLRDLYRAKHDKAHMIKSAADAQPRLR